MSNKSPKVSVIMPVYNVEEYLVEAIESILSQSFQDFEFLIIDDCSTDDSLKLLKQFQKIDDRIRVFKRLENVGITKNLNYLLSQTSGEYVARMDGDDISAIDRFQKQVDLLNLNIGTDLVWSGGNIIFENSGNICSIYQPKESLVIRLLSDLRCNYITHPSVMFRKTSVYSNLKGYNEEYKSGQDGELWYRMLRNKMTLQRIDEELISLRSRSSSVTAQRTNRNINENISKAKICLLNRQYSASLPYIKQVDNYKSKVFLYLRYLVGEKLVDLINRIRSNVSYGEKHKFKILPQNAKVVEIK